MLERDAAQAAPRRRWRSNHAEECGAGSTWSAPAELVISDAAGSNDGTSALRTGPQPGGSHPCLVRLKLSTRIPWRRSCRPATKSSTSRARSSRSSVVPAGPLCDGRIRHLASEEHQGPTRPTSCSIAGVGGDQIFAIGLVHPRIEAWPRGRSQTGDGDESPSYLATPGCLTTRTLAARGWPADVELLFRRRSDGGTPMMKLILSSTERPDSCALASAGCERRSPARARAEKRSVGGVLSVTREARLVGRHAEFGAGTGVLITRLPASGFAGSLTGADILPRPSETLPRPMDSDRSERADPAARRILRCHRVDRSDRATRDPRAVSSLASSPPEAQRTAFADDADQESLVCSRCLSCALFRGLSRGSYQAHITALAAEGYFSALPPKPGSRSTML